jgi:hypothetical protein
MVGTATTSRTGLAVGMAVLTAANLVTALALIALAGDRVSSLASIRLGEALALVVPWMAFSVVGTVIVRHRPANRIGWLCCAGGLVVSLVALAVGIASRGLVMDPTPAGALAAAWVAHVGSICIVVVPLMILFRFPTGRPLGRAWRGVELLTVGYAGALMVMVAVEPMPLLGFPGTPNPLGLGTTPRLGAAAFVPVIVGAGLALASQVIRFRNGSTLERRQLRLLAFASLLVGIAFATMTLTSPRLMTDGRLSTLTVVVNAVAFATIPAAIGVAIVRDGLYDIERIVNRTLVYALVSATLASVYGITVVGLTGVLAVLAPGAGGTLATAGATLAVAGLFRPVRARAQGAIDRRFDRERYEAARSIDAFAGQVRTDTDLDSIIGDLGRAATRTVRPSSMACWIRGPHPDGRRIR